MADGASEEIEPSLGRRESHVIDEPHGIEMTFDYLDMIDNLQYSLDIPKVEILCKYFNMTSSLAQIRDSNNPQHYFLLECRREGIFTRNDTTQLLDAFKENGLSTLQRIIEDFNHISKCPDVHVRVNNYNPTIACSSFKTFMLSRKRAIKSVFRRDQGIHFVDCKEGSLVICLKVSSVEELDKLKEYIESRELLRRLMAVYENAISDTNRKDFQSERLSIKLSYDAEEFENAKQQLTTNNASLRRTIAITTSLTQTRTETTILQEEMEEVFHPRIVNQSLSEEDDRDSEEDFLQYLDEVGLKKYFPRKLTMKEATEVRLFPTDDSQIETKDLLFLFMSKLTSLDSRITWKENLHIEGSARDFIYAILHCSDNHLRQHLLEKFASCQLAVPVLLPRVRDDAKPELLTWALSRVVKKWKENETSLAPEKRMVSEPVFTTAFIRFGDIPISKSSVLNNAIGRAQGNETFRYFLSFKDEKEYVYHCSGSVEAQWYLPICGRKEDLLKEVTLLLNLRGDSKEFTTESEFLCSIANAIFILVDKRNLVCYETAIDDIKERFKNVFVIHLIAQKAKIGIQKRKKQLNNKSKTLIIDENDDSVDFGVERNETELAKIICKKIVQYCNCTSRADYCSIEDWRSFCCNTINVDQDNDSYKRAKKLLQSSFPIQDSIEEVKKLYLQLQDEWVKWVEADKKPLCVGEQTVANQFEAKEKTKRDLRREQREKGLSAKMKIFLENLQTVLFDEEDLLHYFMSFFQTHIEMMVAREIPPLVVGIDVLNTSLQKKKSAIQQALSSERSKLQNEIKELQKHLLKESEKVSAKNISCEHFIRELGHWYEASLQDTNCHGENETLVIMASKLLLAGYPLELLDGETAYIPIKWISGVLMNLSNALNNPNIFVLSIIGIQSSGKSTLLNSMFGVKLPVRAGRCTRGLYLQLLEVNVTFHKQLGFEYLLIIDTEGLHSPDRTVLNDHTFDNSIATLVMCIGDLTLLNIGQETIGPDMIGILQIVVHALIRMNEVELVSNCRIIQQRVSDLAAAANNKGSMTKIKDALNKATRIAAAEAKVHHIQNFSDVFPLAEGDDLQFFPCLWMGLMSPPNPGYSDKIHALKDAIFKSKVNQPVIPPQFTMAKFVRRLEDVWKAVKSEDFVFHFQNSFDAFSNQRFRNEHQKLIGGMRTEIFAHYDSRNITNATKEDFYRRLEIEITNKCEDINKEIDQYVKEHSDEEEVKRRQESIKNETIDIGKDLERSIKETTEIQLQYKADKKGLPNFIRRAKEELKIAAKQEAERLKDTRSTSYWKENHKELERQFDVIWDKKVEQLDTEFQKIKITEEDIEKACDNSLRKLMLGTEHSKEYNDRMHDNKKRWNLKELWKDVSSWVGKHFSGSKDGLDKVQHAVSEIVNCHKDDIINHAKDKPFQQAHVVTIFNEVYYVLAHSNVNSKFVVSTLRAVQNEVCTVFKDCQLKYASHNSLQGMFESEKDCLNEEFKSYVDATIKIRAAVKRSYSECMSVLRNVTLHAFNVNLLEQMRLKDCYNNKQRMLGRILEELCLQKDPKLYYDFIEDNDKFVRDWLNKKVLNEITARSQYWVRDVDTKINELLGYVQSALRKTKSELTARGGEQTTTFREWANAFLKNNYLSKYGKDIHFSVEDFNLIDLKEFTNMLYSMFSSHLKTDITKGWNVDKLSDLSVASNLYSKMLDVARDILDHLGTCKEICPFCKVPCHMQIKGEHKHTAIFHYSQGVAGYHYEKSLKLVSEPCTMLVASNTRYRCRIGPPKEYRPYNEYTVDYPSWDITPITGDTPITYWKWVLQTFNNDFAELYKTKPAELPIEWRTVSEEDALKSIRENYHLNSN
ncbi:interferon-induced very large GTPase 1-like [Apostichopus japonicus]|uniref:interferon-induced very large GTPase 1-like n=1 Tax=Stichopus japonicus TaxID=307972 RepID=UPI003AB28DCF